MHWIVYGIKYCIGFVEALMISIYEINFIGTGVVCLIVNIVACCISTGEALNQHVKPLMVFCIGLELVQWN